MLKIANKNKGWGGGDSKLQKVAAVRLGAAGVRALAKHLQRVCL